MTFESVVAECPRSRTNRKTLARSEHYWFWPKAVILANAGRRYLTGRWAAPTLCLTWELPPRVITITDRLRLSRDRQGKEMAAKRKIEVFSAGCATCQETIETIKRAACPSCEVIIHDMRDGEVAKRAMALGIRSIPAVVIEGELAACCAGRGVDEAVLRAAGLGRPA
jgi:glutaredoxin 3